jgi:hypothetical protein
MLCWLALAGAAAPAVAQSVMGGQREYNVKAVSLYAFGRYVTWPDSAFASNTAPFVIGVLGGNPFGEALEQIAAKKQLNGRAIEVRQIAAPAEALACQIVFVTRVISPEAEKQLLDLARGRPVLLVGESPGFNDRGGIINFYVSGANVRFELNPERGAMSQLSLNAKLLSLGTKAQSQP